MWLFTSIGLAAPSVEELRAAWNRVDATVWNYQPALSAADLQRLAAGKPVKRRERLEGADRVVAALWSAATKEQVWLAVQDAKHFEVVNGYVDEDLAGSVFADRILYQRIDLPWPFSPRQWVVRVRNNRALLKASDNTIWERFWEVSDRRGASLEDPDAVWVEQTSGAWTLCDAGAGTLLVYSVRAAVGGNIPDEAGTQWALMTVGGMLAGVDERARTQVGPHYTTGHPTIDGADGVPIPLFTR